MDSNLQNIVRLVDYIEYQLINMWYSVLMGNVKILCSQSSNIFIGNGFLKRLVS
ncbi:MAG: hypothetical protein ACRC3H_13985 [Lachnospiraceae bacterium]